MTRANGAGLPPDIYPPEPWALVESRFAPEHLPLTETTFALSNGTIGIRGSLDEGEPSHEHGTYVNGFHETWPITYPESAYGLARTGQTIVNVPDATVIHVTVDGERFRLDGQEGMSFRRVLDFRTGILERSVEWTTSSGARIEMRSRRLVSFSHRNVAAFALEISSDRDVDLDLESRMINRQDAPRPPAERDDPRRGQPLTHRVLQPGSASFDGYRTVQGWVTSHSGMGLLAAMDHALTGGKATFTAHRRADDLAVGLHLRMPADSPITLTKFAAYESFPEAPTSDDRAGLQATLDEVVGLGFDGLAAEQVRKLDRFWAEADVEIGAPPVTQQAIRWLLFQLFQASAQLSGGSIPAKGLTGNAYDGHYFWDTEIYLLPFLIYTQPEIAARILGFRHTTLPAARGRAAELASRGALFPWRTINGEEASAFFPAGTAQFHIDADVIYALKKYVEATGDDDFLWAQGVELAVETARMWEDLGFYRGNEFHIHGVTGPDEYTALVDDNSYTNRMARMNLRFASEVVRRMRSEQPDRFAVLSGRLELVGDEGRRWEAAADAMHIPHDLELGITPQDETFLSQEPWDFAGTPADRHPLLLHFHPLVIYRHQVIKQCDTVLADFLLGNEVPDDLRRANFDYYEPLTTGDSSLSASIQAIVASELGYQELALRHFDRALFVDLADLAGNTSDGVHMASSGGGWMALVFGFGGFRDHDGHFSIDPRLPQEWSFLRFRLRIRGCLLTVTVTHADVAVTASGKATRLWVFGRPHDLEPGTAVRLPYPARSGAGLSPNR